jgi:hypothetical protein
VPRNGSPPVRRRSGAGVALLALAVSACSGSAGGVVGPAVPGATSGDVAATLGPATMALIASVNPAGSAARASALVAPVAATAPGAGVPAPAAGFGQISIGTFTWETSSGTAGRWMTAPAAQLSAKKTLIVVHGLLGNVQADFPCAGNLKAAGGYDQVLGYGYDWSQTPASQSSGLAGIVDALPAGTPVDIEAHSLGALVTLAAIPAMSHPLQHVVFLGGPLPPTGVPQANPSDFFTYLAFTETLSLVAPAYAAAIDANVLPFMKPNGGNALAEAARASGHEDDVIFTTVAGIGLIDVDGFDESQQLDTLLFTGRPNDGLVLEKAALDESYLPTTTGARAFNDGSSIDNHIGLTCSDPDIWSYVGGRVQT